MTELWQLGALEIADAVRTGTTTSREVLQAHYDRIDAVNGRLNAVVARMDDEAFAAADAADEAVAAGESLGPLHGVPLSVKENIDVAGWATTHGLAAMADAIAPVDAPVVERMRAAGAIPFVRTNLPDFGLRVHTVSSLRGLTRNPWNPDVTAGGSSGGEGSALASGMSPLGLGNDIGGSLRNPAHCCGIAAIKPTTGVVPHASALPPEDSGITSQLMAVEGVMARHVADVRAGLLAAVGAHDRDPVSVPVTLPAPADGARLRIAVLTDPPAGPTDPGISAEIRRAADVLSDAGHQVDDAAPTSFERAIELWGELLIMDISAMRPLIDAVMGEGGRRFLDMAEHRLTPTDAAGWSMLFAERHGLAREWTTFFGSWDVLLTPTWSMRAFEHDADIASPESAVAALETIRAVVPANLLGLPAAVAPVGVVDGLPVGAQFTGARFADLTTLAAAQALEDIVGTITPIDPMA